MPRANALRPLIEPGPLFKHRLTQLERDAAVAKYRTHLAYREAAAFVEAARIPVPLIEADAHVNHVLDGVAALLRERAAKLLPS